MSRKPKFKFRTEDVVRTYHALKSMKVTAKKLGCCEPTVRAHLRRAGERPVYGPVNLNLDPQEVARLYRKLHSTGRVARQLGCSVPTVMIYLKKAGQDCVYRTGPRPWVVPRNKLNLDERDVAKAYKKLKNMAKVAEKFECSSSVISAILDKHKIARTRPPVTKEQLKKLHDGHMRARHMGMGAGEQHPSWRGGKKTYACSVCGTLIQRAPSSVGEHTICSKECQRVFNLSRQGEKAGGWKGGLTPLQKLIRNSMRYKAWRLAVYERDGFACQDCIGRGGDLNAHHLEQMSDLLTMYKIKTMADAEMCKALWDVDNGLTVCVRCHQKRHPELNLVMLKTS